MTRTIALSVLFIAGLIEGSSVEVLAGTGSFAFTGSLNTARRDHPATLLQNGEMLVTGGTDVSTNPLAVVPPIANRRPESRP